MKKVLKALTIAAAFTFVQGVYVGMPIDASAAFNAGGSIITVIPDLTTDFYTTVHAGYVQPTAGFVLPSGTNTFTAGGLQLAGGTTSTLRGTLAVTEFLGAGTMNINPVDPALSTPPTKIQGDVSFDIGAMLGIRAAGYTPRPAPNPPKHDADFAMIVRGTMDLTNLLLDWDYGLAPGDAGYVGLIKSLGGFTGSLRGTTVPSGWQIQLMDYQQMLLALATQSAGSGSTMTTYSAAVSAPEDPTTTEYLFATKAPVPEPSTILLLGGGLAGMVAYRSRKRKSEGKK